jgi:hypothetical protein
MAQAEAKNFSAVVGFHSGQSALSGLPTAALPRSTCTLRKSRNTAGCEIETHGQLALTKSIRRAMGSYRLVLGNLLNRGLCVGVANVELGALDLFDDAGDLVERFSISFDPQHLVLEFVLGESGERVGDEASHIPGGSKRSRSLSPANDCHDAIREIEAGERLEEEVEKRAVDDDERRQAERLEERLDARLGTEGRVGRCDGLVCRVETKFAEICAERSTCTVLEEAGYRKGARGNKQLDACLGSSLGKSRLNGKSCTRQGANDNVNAFQAVDERGL